MLRLFSKNGAGSVAVEVAKAAAAIAFLSVIAAHWLSSTLTASDADRARLGQLAQTATRDKADPVTTGSLAKRAQNIRLDPCTGDRRN